MALFESSNVEVTRLSKWLDWASGFDESEFIALPMIQRGSVWKPEQIINLWDTLLRGMPVGSFMVNSMPAGTKVRRIGRSNKTAEELKTDGLALLDGQQRTLSMLLAWPNAEPMDRRLWVDFADEPGQGQLLRLRVTSDSHKFGYQRQSPSTKLPLEDRRKAWEAYEAEHGEGKPLELSHTRPFTNGNSLPLELRDLIKSWLGCRQDKESWGRQIESLLATIKKYKASKKDELGKVVWEPYFVWTALDEAKKAHIRHRIELLATALERLFLIDIPVIRVADEIFKGEANKDALEPPLAIWFQRIGAGGTALSNADYAYSVIKHRYPDAYGLVETLHGSGNIAKTLSATDLVMTALRLAVAEHKWNGGQPVADAANPDKHQFHTILNQGGDEFLQMGFIPLLKTESGLKEAFVELESVIRYQEDACSNGLPLLAFPLLGRPLVQVLLRWVRLALKSGQGRELVKSSEPEILRFVLFWMMWVKDPNKASEIAFRELKAGSAEIFPAKAIYKSLLDQDVAFALLAPDLLSNVPGLRDSPEGHEDKPLRGWNGRFFVQDDTEAHQKSRIFYARWWNKNGGYVHPILLWLQRALVNTMSSDDVQAGREDETPYDYDHICPSSHWHDWRGHTDSTRLPDFCRDPDAHWRVGNSIGNVRVWDSVKNRSDGDASPAVKLRLQDATKRERDEPTQSELLGWSAIPEGHKEAWESCSRDEANKKAWDADRASAFQRAVEQRAFHLYERYFTDLGFDHWLADFEAVSDVSDAGLIGMPHELSSESVNAV